MIPELYLVSCGWCEYQVALQVGAELLSLAELLLLPVQALVEPAEQRLEPRPCGLLRPKLLEQRLFLLARLLGVKARVRVRAKVRVRIGFTAGDRVRVGFTAGVGVTVGLGVRLRVRLRVRPPLAGMPA